MGPGVLSPKPLSHCTHCPKPIDMELGVLKMGFRLRTIANKANNLSPGRFKKQVVEDTFTT